MWTHAEPCDSCLLCTVRASLPARQGPSSCVLRRKAADIAMIWTFLSSHVPQEPGWKAAE